MQSTAQLKLYQKQRLKETDIATAFSYYLQDGEHSAITGGMGTEELSVFSATSDMVHRFDSIRQFSVGLGLDYISSASTDKIDFDVSSASSHDQRIYTHAGYAQLVPGSFWELGGSLYLSVESDYLSAGISFQASHIASSKDRKVSFDLGYFRDDLRWRKNIFKPTELIYPEELRDTSWFDMHHRHSVNFNMRFRQDLNRRMTIALVPGFIYQSGLLSTPFHRVYFAGRQDLRVEKLPRSKWQLPLGIQWNYFISPGVIARTYYQYFTDSFGIKAHSMALELPVKLGSFITLTPHIRYYKQEGSRYFNSFGAHSQDEEYYTSDYDLSDFRSVKWGLEWKSKSHKKLFKYNWLFDEFSLRYAYYWRSDGLSAHIISSLFDLNKRKIK